MTLDSCVEIFYLSWIFCVFHLSSSCNSWCHVTPSVQLSGGGGLLFSRPAETDEEDEDDDDRLQGNGTLPVSPLDWFPPSPLNWVPPSRLVPPSKRCFFHLSALDPPIRSFATNLLSSCLTDKIEEAQKELKDPKSSQKGETSAANYPLSLSE